MADNFPYSYHTFLFSFLWNNGGKTTRKNFEDVLSIGRRWFDTGWKKERIPGGSTEKEGRQYYAAFQYFTELARKVILSRSKTV